MHFLQRPKHTDGALCEDLQKDLKNVSEHAEGMVAAYCSIITRYQSVMKKMEEEHHKTSPLVEASKTFQKDLLTASQHFQECLTDLTAMCMAMEPVMQSAPEATVALITNFFASFSRQLCAFYGEVSAAASLNGTLFQKGAFDIIQQTAPPSSSSSPSGSSLPTAAAVTASHLTSGSPNSPTSPSADAGISAEGSWSGTAEGMGMEMPASDGLVAGSSFDSAAAAAGNGDPVTGLKTGKKKRKVLKHAAATVTTPTDGAPRISREDPDFLTVTTSVESALGRAVLQKRPDVFSPLNRSVLSRTAPDLTIYFRFPPDKGLVDWLVEHYLSVPNEYLAGVANEVLRTSSFDMDFGLFSSVDGPVIPPEKPSEFRSLPPCGWRVMHSSDHTTRLYSLYMLLQGPAPQGRYMVVHEVIVAEGSQEEVVWVIKEEGTSSYTSSASAGPATFGVISVFSASMRSSSKTCTAALIRCVRARGADCNFTEVSEAEVRAATTAAGVKRHDRAMDAMALHLRGNSEAETDGGQAFAPTSVRLAALDDPVPTERDDLEIARNIIYTPFRVADGLAKGALTMLTAPKTVGKAVMDITGVSDAMRSNMEALLRRSCPQLSDQEMLDASSCTCTAKNIKEDAKNGTFFLLTHCMCFLPSAPARSVILEYEEIKEVKKCRTERGESLDVTSHIGERYVISNLSDRNQSYTIFMKQWLDA